MRMQESELKLNLLNSKEVGLFFQANKFKHIFSYLQYQQSLSSGLENCLEFLKEVVSNQKKVKPKKPFL